MKSDSTSILLDLIIKKSVSGLSREDQQLMDELIAASPDPAGADRTVQQFEITVAALDYASLSVDDRENLADQLGVSLPQVEDTMNACQHNGATHLPEGPGMPAHLRQAIIADGMAYVNKTWGSGATQTMPDPSVLAREDLRPEDAVGEFRPRGVHVAQQSLIDLIAAQAGKLGQSLLRLPKAGEVGMLVCAAASLLALALFLRQPSNSAETPKFAALEDEAPSLILMDEYAVNNHQRDAFLTNPPVDMIRVAVLPGDQASVTGEVLWSDSQQKGFLTLSGLAINDPEKFQYQVWIFDTDVNQAYPVSGGIFDVVDQRQAVMALKAGLKVNKAVQFLVTRERPSGAVVSTRSNSAAVATR